MAVDKDRHGKFRTRVKVNGKERYFGPYLTRKEARIKDLEFKIKLLTDHLADVKANKVDLRTAPRVQDEVFG